MTSVFNVKATPAIQQTTMISKDTSSVPQSKQPHSVMRGITWLTKTKDKSQYTAMVTDITLFGDTFKGQLSESNDQ